MGDCVMIHRRSFLFGIGSALAAPAIVRASSLMPVKALRSVHYYAQNPVSFVGDYPTITLWSCAGGMDRDREESLLATLKDINHSLRMPIDMSVFIDTSPITIGIPR